MAFIRAHKIEIRIFLLALVTRLLYFSLDLHAEHGILIAVLNRGDGYFDIAQNIILGHGYSILHAAPYTPTAYRTPGLPYFIVGTYFLLGSYFAAIMVQIVLTSIVPLLGMSLARYITPMRGVGVAVGIFLALEPTSILFSVQFLSEALFTFLFSLALLCLFQYWREKTISMLLSAAFLLGLSVLVRPSIEYLPFIIVGLILWEARRSLSRQLFMRVGAFVFVFALVLVPWFYRNYQTFGVIGLSSQQGTALYAVTVPSVLAVEHKTSFAQEYNTEIAGPNDANFAQSSEYAKRAVPILLAHPRALMLMSVETAFSFFTYDGTYDVLRTIGLDGDMYAALNHAKLQSGMQPSTPTLFLVSRPIALLRFMAALMMTPVVLVLAGRVAWLLITLGFFVGAWHSMRRTQEPIYALAAVVIVMYLMLTTILTGFTVNYRYRMPVNALIFTFAAYEVAVLTPWMRKKILHRAN